MEFLLSDVLGIGEWLVESVTNVLRRASFWLCEQVYPLIPDLYEIAETLAKYTFFTDETINKVSRNIYILVSVLMLFALGIKLLSAIVNPENFSGDKGSKGKSFKSTFFRSITAVFLIILTPMAFNTAYDVQNHIIENSLIERILLGVDLAGDTSGGQILAGYSFSTFCHPSDDSTTISEYEDIISRNIDDIDELEPFINKKGSSTLIGSALEAGFTAMTGGGIPGYVSIITDLIGSKKELEFNGLLCPAVGILLIYELIILSMDLGLRSVKLGLLQLMSPIVIASYIFKGEILSKWFKEVLSTYLICFLKIAAITFMVFGMTELSGFLDRRELIPLSAGAKRITQLFIIIGLLQVIKLIPNIINSIFGTNIQNRGGIRGRLGEMAAVGGLAQKAWDAIKTPAAKIAGIGLTAAGLGLPGLLAAGAGGWAAHKTWNKGWGNKGPLKDTKFGRAARTVGAAGSAVGTALTTKGGIFKSIEAGKKKYKDNEIAGINKEVRERKKSGKIQDRFKIGDDNRLTDISNVDRSLNEKIDKINSMNISADEKKRKIKNAEAAAAKMRYNIASNSSSNVSDYITDSFAENFINGNVSKAAIKTSDALAKKTQTEKVAGKYEAVKDNLQQMINNAEPGSETATQLKNMLSNLNKGMAVSEVVGEIDSLKSSGAINIAEGEIGKLKADSNDYENALNARINLSDGSTFGVKDTMLKSNMGGYSVSAFNDAKKSAEDAYNNANSGLEREERIAGLNDEQKARVKDVMDYVNIVHTTVSNTSAKYNPNGAVQFTPPSQSAPQQQPNPQPAPQQTQNVPDQGGYDDYLDWNDAGGDQSSQPIQPTSRPRPSNNTSSTSDTGGYDDYEDYNDSHSNGYSSGNNQQSGSNESNNTNNEQVDDSNGGSVNGANINVTADVDMKELSTKLDTINQSITAAGTQVSSAVNGQGETINGKLDNANDHLSTMDRNIQTMINNNDKDDKK